MQDLHPSFKKARGDMSGICHHMMMEKHYLSEIIDMVIDELGDDLYQCEADGCDYYACNEHSKDICWESDDGEWEMLICNSCYTKPENLERCVSGKFATNIRNIYEHGS